MEIFSNKKRKRFFGIYLLLSFIVLVICLQYLNHNDNHQFSFSNDDFVRVSNAASASNLVLFILITYLIMFSFLIMKFKMHLAYKKRYRSFYDLSQNEQNEILGNVFCAKCLICKEMKFKNEYMVEGMRWIECSCPKCTTINKVRLT